MTKANAKDVLLETITAAISDLTGGKRTQPDMVLNDIMIKHADICRYFMFYCRSSSNFRIGNNL